MSQPSAQPNPEVLDEIVHLEWQMLQQINVGGPRAGCQDDPTTFKAMRTGQFANWSAAAAGAYLDDLRQAIASGRNLVAEKYVNMMILESPALRATYASMASAPSPRAQDTAARILHILLAQNEQLSARYPHALATARPLHASEDDAEHTSIETYQKGELYTYSERTLDALLAWIEELQAHDQSYAELVLNASFAHSGFATVAAAERHLATQEA